MANARRSRRFCTVPGCEHSLSKFNRSGVCMVHIHAPGLCQCPTCLGVAGVRRVAPVGRAGVRSVEVAGYSPVSSGNVPKMRVSLPCEPWARGDA
jgi:hypothetical protein